MNKVLIIGVIVTLSGIFLDGMTVRNYDDRRNLLSLFIIAIGSSMIVVKISPLLNSMNGKILGGVLLILGLILRFGEGKFPLFDYRSSNNYDDSKVKRWIKFNSRGLVFSIIFTGVLFLADITNLIPKNTEKSIEK